MKNKTIIWIVVGVIVIIALYMLFKPTKASAQTPGKINTAPEASNPFEKWFKAAQDAYKLIQKNKQTQTPFVQTPPINPETGCDANGLDKDGFVCSWGY